MKKHFFIFLIFNFSVVSLSLSQLYVGPRIGYSSASISKSIDSKKPINSLLMGAVINYQFHTNFSIQAEVDYSKKGGGQGLIMGGVEYAEYTEFKTIEIPLSAKLTVGTTKAKFTASLGPYIGIALNGKQIVVDSGKVTTTPANFDFFDADKRKINKLDFGINLGLGSSIDLGQGKLLLDIKYGIGLRNWYSYDGNNPGIIGEVKNRIFAVSAGYIYPIAFK
ncbi:MAG: PorT family protein [Cytophagaceae bacterium]|nr:PorT family protein [Cytophagaceae bacterium]